MRKLYLSFVLPLLMLLAQQGAAWHEISHLHQPPSQQRQAQQRDDPADAPCEACLAFSQIAAAVAGGVAALPPCRFAHALPAACAVAVRAAAAPAPRSRGPPVFL